MYQSRKLALVAAVGLFLGAHAAQANVIYDLTLTPTSGTVLIGGTGTFTISSAPSTTLNSVSNYYQTPKNGSGTLVSLSITIDGQTFGLPQENTNGNALAQFTSGTLDDITYAGTSNGFALDTTGGYVFYLKDNGGDTIGTFTASLATDPPGPVPEPTSLALFGAAFAGFGFLRRRRSAK